MAEYERARVGVDPVVFTILDGQLQVLLHTREKEPFKGQEELPGGLLREGERPEERLRVKLREMTGKEDIYFDQFGVFAAPDRDPRERTVSIGYMALVDDSHVADPTRWFPVDDLPELAFDHRRIVDAAYGYMQENLDTVIVQQFMPELFPLNDLQRAYEVIEDEEHDNRNFRRRMISQGIVEETGKKQQDVSHRPAKLYRFSE